MIDDVGTGHSGLSYMLKLGVDIIKIDKMFVDAIGTDRNSTTIVETLIDLAHNMRMDVVAEGVENFEQVMHLRELGIRSAHCAGVAPQSLPAAGRSHGCIAGLGHRAEGGIGRRGAKSGTGRRPTKRPSKRPSQRRLSAPIHHVLMLKRAASRPPSLNATREEPRSGSAIERRPT